MRPFHQFVPHISELQADDRARWMENDKEVNGLTSDQNVRNKVEQSFVVLNGIYKLLTDKEQHAQLTGHSSISGSSLKLQIFNLDAMQ